MVRKQGSGFLTLRRLIFVSGFIIKHLNVDKSKFCYCYQCFNLFPHDEFLQCLSKHLLSGNFFPGTILRSTGSHMFHVSSCSNSSMFGLEK